MLDTLVEMVLKIIVIALIIMIVELLLLLLHIIFEEIQNKHILRDIGVES